MKGPPVAEELILELHYHQKLAYYCHTQAPAHDSDVVFEELSVSFSLSKAVAEEIKQLQPIQAFSLHGPTLVGLLAAHNVEVHHMGNRRQTTTRRSIKHYWGTRGKLRKVPNISTAYLALCNNPRCLTVNECHL